MEIPKIETTYISSKQSLTRQQEEIQSNSQLSFTRLTKNTLQGKVQTQLTTNVDAVNKL